MPTEKNANMIFLSFDNQEVVEFNTNIEILLQSNNGFRPAKSIASIAAREDPFLFWLSWWAMGILVTNWWQFLSTLEIEEKALCSGCFNMWIFRSKYVYKI